MTSNQDINQLIEGTQN